MNYIKINEIIFPENEQAATVILVVDNQMHD